MGKKSETINIFFLYCSRITSTSYFVRAFLFKAQQENNIKILNNLGTKVHGWLCSVHWYRKLWSISQKWKHALAIVKSSIIASIQKWYRRYQKGKVECLEREYFWTTAVSTLRNLCIRTTFNHFYGTFLRENIWLHEYSGWFWNMSFPWLAWRRNCKWRKWERNVVSHSVEYILLNCRSRFVPRSSNWSISLGYSERCYMWSMVFYKPSCPRREMVFL